MHCRIGILSWPVFTPIKIFLIVDLLTFHKSVTVNHFISGVELGYQEIDINSGNNVSDTVSKVSHYYSQINFHF